MGKTLQQNKAKDERWQRAEADPDKKVDGTLRQIRQSSSRTHVVGDLAFLLGIAQSDLREMKLMMLAFLGSCACCLSIRPSLAKASFLKPIVLSAL